MTGFSLEPGLAAIVRPGVIWWTGATVVQHEHRLDSLLAEAEARVRTTPPAEVVSLAPVQKGGLDPHGRGRPRSAAARVRRATPFRG